MYREVRDSWKCGRYVPSRGHNIKRNVDKEKLLVIVEFYVRMSSSNMCFEVLKLRKVTS